MQKPEKELFQLHSFWAAIYIPTLLALIPFVFIASTSNLEYLAGYKGLNNLIDIFKIPLSIIALVFPSVALVTANHRSAQSARQIAATDSQILNNIIHNKISVKPILSTHLDNTGKEFTFSICNVGMGVAIVDEVTYFLHGANCNYDDLTESISDEVKTLQPITSFSVMDITNNAKLGKDDKFIFVRIIFHTSIENAGIYNSLIDNVRDMISIKIEYKSIYGEQFSYDSFHQLDR